MKILCAEGHEALDELKKETISILPNLNKPLFAFNCDFEIGALFHSCDVLVEFHGELNKEKFEAKKNAVKLLGIPNHNDPFYDDGKKCKNAWLRGDYESSIKHNRSCLLKERDILLKRKPRKPSGMRIHRLK